MTEQEWMNVVKERDAEIARLRGQLIRLEFEAVQAITANVAEARREEQWELERAEAQHGAMHGAHEGWAVIYEELDELWDEVLAKKQDPGAMRKEALQVAAMALRFIKDVCDPALRARPAEEK